MNSIMLILISGLLISGFVFLLDFFILKKRRKKTGSKPSVIIEGIISLFPVLLIVLIIRAFVVQPYRVPTGSLEPTIVPGDFILVNQFAYGLHLPLLNKKILEIGEPKRGDITLFQFPKNKSLVYVKRIIGLPGDYIEYTNKNLYINGEKCDSKKIINLDNKIIKKKEDLLGISHEILISSNKNLNQDFYLVVPDRNYFVMGDNRDNSFDSRYWGFVPEENLVGKAMFVWFSWDKEHYRVCWDRIGKVIH